MRKGLETVAETDPELAEFILLSLPNFNHKLLIRTFLLLGDLYYQAKDWVLAANLYHFAIKTGNFTRYFPLQCTSLQKLAKAMRKMVYRKMALKCLIKALEYAFFYKDRKQEIEIYDQLGRLYYEGGDLSTSLYYHER